MGKTKVNTSLLNIDTPLELATFREAYRHSDSYHCGKIIFELCDIIAGLRSWDLDALIPEIKAEQARWRAEQEAQAEVRKQEELERRTQHYIKKHGHAPPTENDKANALAKLTVIERKALGLYD